MGKLWEYSDYRNEILLKASLTVAIIMARMPPAVFTVGVGALNVFSRQLIYSIAPNVMYHAIT